MSADKDSDAPPGDQWNLGITRLRNGEYWEAHEAWEDVWQELPNPSAARRATQALIQLAAICYKPEQARRGRDPAAMQRGMERLLETARDHLDASRTLEAPKPEWERRELETTLSRLDAILEGWKQGRPLDEVRGDIADAVGEFAPRSSD